MINPSFTRGEYWLLEAVVQFNLPIWWLYWSEMELALNKTGHGMPRELLIETLHKLFIEGLIVATENRNYDNLLQLDPEQIEIALSEDQSTRKSKKYHYQLTHKGGEYWEAFANPNWNLFIDACHEEPDDDSDIWNGEIICPNKRHLESYYESVSYYDYNVIEGTEKVDTVEPWQATYWKEIPIGHRIKFKGYEKIKEEDYKTPKPIDQLWYDHLWYQWR